MRGRRTSNPPIRFDEHGEFRAVPLSPALSAVLLEWKEACPPPTETPDAPCLPCGGHHGRRVCKDSMLAALDAAYVATNVGNGESSRA